MTNDKRDEQFMEDLLGKSYKVGGVELRPPAMASFAILRAGGSALLTSGAEVAAAPEIELLKFIVLLDATRTAKEAYALSQDKEKLMDACLDLGQSIGFTEMGALTLAIGAYINESIRNKVELIPDPKNVDPPKTQGA